MKPVNKMLIREVTTEYLKLVEKQQNKRTAQTHVIPRMKELRKELDKRIGDKNWREPEPSLHYVGWPISHLEPR